MSFWKRSMEYLGLGPDDAYDDYDDGPEPEPSGRQRHRDDHSRSSLACRGRRSPSPGPSEPCRRGPAFRHATSRAAADLPPPVIDESGVPSRPSAVVAFGCATSHGGAGDGPAAPLRPGSGACRPVQGGQLGHPQSRIRRPRRHPPPRRLRQRRVLCTRRHDGEGGDRRLPAQACPDSHPSLRRLRKLNCTDGDQPARHPRPSIHHRQAGRIRPARGRGISHRGRRGARAGDSGGHGDGGACPRRRRSPPGAAAAGAERPGPGGQRRPGAAPPVETRPRRSVARCCSPNAPPTPRSPRPSARRTRSSSPPRSESRQGWRGRTRSRRGRGPGVARPARLPRVRRRSARPVPGHPARSHHRRRHRPQRHHGPRRQWARPDATPTTVGVRQRSLRRGRRALRAERSRPRRARKRPTLPS